MFDRKSDLRLELAEQPLTAANRQAAIERRYQARVFVSAYWVFDRKTGWTPCYSDRTGSRHGVNIVNYRVIKRNGTWSAAVRSTSSSTSLRAAALRGGPDSDDVRKRIL